MLQSAEKMSPIIFSQFVISRGQWTSSSPSSLSCLVVWWLIAFSTPTVLSAVHCNVLLLLWPLLLLRRQCLFCGCLLHGESLIDALLRFPRLTLSISPWSRCCVRLLLWATTTSTPCWTCNWSHESTSNRAVPTTPDVQATTATKQMWYHPAKQQRVAHGPSGLREIFIQFFSHLVVYMVNPRILFIPFVSRWIVSSSPPPSSEESQGVFSNLDFPFF